METVEQSLPKGEKKSLCFLFHCISSLPTHCSILCDAVNLGSALGRDVNYGTRKSWGTHSMISPQLSLGRADSQVSPVFPEGSHQLLWLYVLL